MYKKIINEQNGDVSCIMQINEDGTCISFLLDPANTDYQKYLEWLAEGNEPLPPEGEA